MRNIPHPAANFLFSFFYFLQRAKTIDHQPTTQKKKKNGRMGWGGGRSGGWMIPHPFDLRHTAKSERLCCNTDTFRKSKPANGGEKMCSPTNFFFLFLETRGQSTMTAEKWRMGEGGLTTGLPPLSAFDTSPTNSPTPQPSTSAVPLGLRHILDEVANLSAFDTSSTTSTPISAFDTSPTRSSTPQPPTRRRRHPPLPSAFDTSSTTKGCVATPPSLKTKAKGGGGGGDTPLPQKTTKKKSPKK
jgi:hypothetical protein